MTTILRSLLSPVSIPDAAEAAILTVTIPLIGSAQPVAIQWCGTVDTPAAGVTAQLARLRRGGRDGVEIDRIDDLRMISNSAGDVYRAIAPAIDTPGLPATVDYTVTLEMVDAVGASNGILGFLYVTYD